MKLWDVATHRELLTLKDLSSSIDTVAFTPDGHRLLGVLSSSRRPSEMVHIWDATPLADGPQR